MGHLNHHIETCNKWKEQTSIGIENWVNGKNAGMKVNEWHIRLQSDSGHERKHSLEP